MSSLIHPRWRVRAASPRHLHLEALESRLLLSVNVLTYHNDTSSDGQNLGETLLTPADVNTLSFGKGLTMPVDGQVYAQPLVKTAVNITVGPNKGLHDVVLVATEHDSVYAFDANTGVLLWHDSFLGNGVTSVPVADVQADEITPETGITSTPVINPATNILYVEAKTREVRADGVHYVHRLHALNISSGAEVAGSPALIADSLGDSYVAGPTVNGTGATPPNAPPGTVAFDALRQLNRTALSLVNGRIYVGFASPGDIGPYHGWILGYDAATLALDAVFNSTPNGSEGGIWQGGGRIASDSAGNLYLQTGNGTFDTTLDGRNFPASGDYGDSFVKLAVDPVHVSAANQNANGWGLQVLDYFTPQNQDALSSTDADLGSGGPLLLPDSAGSVAHPHLLVGAGKEGTVYLIDRDNMGKFDPAADHVVQEQASAISSSFDTPAFFNGTFYYTDGIGVVRAFAVSNGAFTAQPLSQSPDGFDFPGPSPSISANGTANGIVWAIDHGTNELRAYDAANLATELYTSDQAPGNRDALGSSVKFAVATVANGRVYVGTGDSLVVYSVFSPDLTVSLANLRPTRSPYVPGDTITIPVTIRNNGFSPAVGTKSAPIVLDIRASADNGYDSGDALLARFQWSGTLGAHRTITRNITFKLPSTVAAGDIYAVALIDSTGVLHELNKSNNTAALAAPVSVAWNFGNVPGRTGSTPLTYTDDDGTSVTLKLSGPGLGTLTRDANGYSIDLSGTTAASRLTVATARTRTPGDDGRTSLFNLTVDAALGNVNAPTTDFVGNVAFDGPVTKLTFGSVNGGASGSTFTVAGRLNTLGIKGDLANTSLTAVSIGTLTVTGAVTGSQLHLSQTVSPVVKALSSLTAGQIINSQIRSAGNIGSITTNILNASLIFAGVNDSVTTRPATGDFVNADASLLPTILSLTIKGLKTDPTGAVFINSNVAAGGIIKATMPARATAIGDVDGVAQPFGFATRVAKMTTYKGPLSAGDYVSGLDSLDV